MTIISKESLKESLEIREGLEGLTAINIATLYRRAPLNRRTTRVQDLWTMYENSSLVLSAWHEDRLIGIARVLSDGIEIAFLCDLAVEPDVQRLGVGKQLLQMVQERTKGCHLMLKDSQIGSNYYANAGFEKLENAWVVKV